LINAKYVCAVMGLAFVPGCPPARASAKAAPPIVVPGGGSDAATACTKIRATGAAPLIDDFEAGKGQILGNDGRGGWWFSYDDGTDGQLLREQVGLSADEGTGRALHVACSGFTSWGAGFGVNLHAASTAVRGCVYDASAYAGVRVRARRRGRLRMSLGDQAHTPTASGGTCTRPGTSCYDIPGMALELEDRWKTFEFPFCAFMSEGWGGSVGGIDPASRSDISGGGWPE
jgi:hypothetical protein